MTTEIVNRTSPQNETVFAGRVKESLDGRTLLKLIFLGLQLRLGENLG